MSNRIRQGYSEVFEIGPQVVARRHGSRDRERLATHRVLELHAARVERDAAAGLRAPGAVFQVAADRAADLRQLRPDLVVASREQLDLDERVVRPAPSVA